MSKNDSEKRIFTLAWEFPPIISGESVVCLRTLKYSRHCYDICCGTPATMESSAVHLPANLRNYPLQGKYLLWPIYAAWLFKKLDHSNNYKIMMSRVMPPNGHLAGLLIKLLKPEIKWVVYFSDPIWNSPFIRFSGLFSNNREQRPNYLLMKIMGLSAKVAVRFGDIYIFNNERLARYILGKQYEKKKKQVVIAPYGHEGVVLDTNTQKHEKFILAHIGQVYGNRNLEALISGVKILKRQSPQLYKGLKIQQVGFICGKECKRIEDSNVADCFEIIEQVDYERSVQYMKAADCLLIIDPNFEHKEQNIYVPVKVFDYMSTGKLIIAIADLDSATADILVKTKSEIAPHDAKSVYEMLRNILQAGTEPDLQKYQSFHCEYGIKKIDDALEKLLNGG